MPPRGRSCIHSFAEDSACWHTLCRGWRGLREAGAHPCLADGHLPATSRPVTPVVVRQQGPPRRTPGSAHRRETRDGVPNILSVDHEKEVCLVPAEGRLVPVLALGEDPVEEAVVRRLSSPRSGRPVVVRIPEALQPARLFHAVSTRRKPPPLPVPGPRGTIPQVARRPLTDAAAKPFRCPSTAGGDQRTGTRCSSPSGGLVPPLALSLLSPERRRVGSCCFTRCCPLPPQSEKPHTPPPEKRLRPNCCTVGHPSSFPSKETCKTPQTDGQWLFAPSGRPDIPTTAQTANGPHRFWAASPVCTGLATR